MRRLPRYYLLLLLLPMQLCGQESAVFIPRAEQPIQPVSPYLHILEDKTDTFTIDDIRKPEKSGEFQFLSNPEIAIPYSTWWVRLNMNPSFSSDSFYLGLLRQEMSGIAQGNDLAEVWVIRNNEIIQHFETGTATPVEKRPVIRPINHNLFPLSMVANMPMTIYWRLQRTVNFAPLQLDFSLQHASVIDLSPSSLDMLAWFYTGIMFILFMFGLVFLLITKERPFVWFACIAAVLCLHMQLLEPDNSLTQLLFPNHPTWQFQLFTILTSFFGILVLQFTRSFAQTKRLLPKWDRMIIIVMGLMIVFLFVALILFELTPRRQIPIYIFLIGFLGTISIGVRLMMTKDRYPRWTGFALIWLFIFQFIGILWNNRILPDWIPNPWAIAQIGMMILLFFALAHRFKQSAKDKAEASKVIEMDTIKSRFFANISHEFRTPLTLMVGPLKQLEDSSLDETQRLKYISMMRRNGNRLLQLINQLLDLSKLEGGKMELRVAKADISGFLKAIASSFDSLAEQNQVNYHMHFPEEQIIGFVDRDKVEKIVVNLLSNAFRFTAAGGQVSFSADHADKRLRITVQDNGTGMPKEQLDKIFDRFHQVAGTEGGTGIGLSLAKELLQLHKGQVSVQSEMGKGSSFRISIPITTEFYSEAEILSSPEIATEENNLNQASADIVSENGDTIPDPSLPLVLIVEDNVDLQQYIGDTLRKNYRVQIAGNGQLGLRNAIELIPDCIISDVMMPEMDGMEMSQRLRKEQATSHIPVILLTARAGSQSRIEGLQTGVDDYLVKPFDGEELIVRVQNLIDQRKHLRDKYSQQVISIQPDAVTVVSTEKEFIDRVRESIDENIDNELFGVAELSAAVHLSRSQLHRKLKALTGQAPNELIRNYRLERAMQLLQQQAGSITEIAFQTGFSSPAYFSKCFSDRYGYAPGEAKKKG